MALVTDLSTETIEEGLNEVFYQAYEKEMVPGFAKIEEVFKNFNSSKHSEYDLRIAGVGQFQEKGEQENINEDYEEEKYKTTYTHTAFSNSVPVSYEYLKDQLYGIVGEKVRRLAFAAKDTQYDKAFSIFRRANNSSYVGADGVQLVDGAHPSESAGTQSNVISGDLSLGNLEEAIRKLMEQKDDRGLIIPQNPSILLVAPARFALANKLVQSELVPDSNNNAINYISKVFPGLRVLQSPYIGAASGGDDDNWFVLGDNHKIKRFVRDPLMTWMDDFKQNRNMNTFYNAYYRESTGWSDWVGVIGGNADWS
jgi:phage major head subunit gpT-like protein